ncbi:MAG: PQQ-binding-like beta-propeller repeat protein [Crocinitomicaceae bacterium]|nr:PQQ-binding-like beta-propeller repeat protein [Crocinitomicaceae bacterium]
MKTILLFSILLVGTTTLFAQDKYTLKIKTTQGHPMPNVDVTAVNGDISITKKTDNAGKVTFTFTEVGTYVLSYLEMKNFGTYEVKEGFRGTFSKTVTYDPKGVFAEKPRVDRSKIAFREVSPTHLKAGGEAVQVTVHIKDNSRAYLPHVDLTIVDCTNGIKYPSESNAAGKATFYLPANGNYEIDLGGVEALRVFKTNNNGGGRAEMVVFYEKTKVKEIAKGDTLIQRNITQTNGTTSHLLFTLTLLDFGGNKLEGEPVYLVAEDKSRVYEGETDGAGVCKFMLQKGTNYIMNLKYEEGVHYVDVTNKRGFGRESTTRRYRGSEAIVQMLADRRLNDKGFVINHQTTPIRKLGKPEGYINKTNTGYELDFASSGPVGTPTVVGNRLYTQQGYYSPNYYCLSAATGQYVWGVELGEAGISPVVHQSGVLLLNTESCTLYAIDAKTGELLWSKWLAGYLYTTPSADGYNVYVVYENGGENPLHPGEGRVLASFNIRTGATNWMSWLDNEAIACPVVAGNEVHVSSLSGRYYVFDKKTGERREASPSIKAVSSPTVTAEEIFITSSINGEERLVVLDRKTLKKKRVYRKKISPALITEQSGLQEKMNFNGGHPVVYKNEIVVLLEKERVSAFDARSEELLWQNDIATTNNQAPIIANGKVFVAGENGKIMSFDLRTGRETKIMDTKGIVDGQPVMRNGLIYVAAGGILKIIRSIKQFEWNQWNKDPSHNLLWED